MKKIIILVLFLTVTAIAIIGCSGGDKETAVILEDGAAEAAGASELNLVATNWQFDQQEYVVKEGEPIKLSLNNAEGMHRVNIRGIGIDLAEGETVTFKPLKAGTYTIICSFPCGTGHSKMNAKLIVQ